MAKKMNWRADLQKICNNREKADNAAKRAEEKRIKQRALLHAACEGVANQLSQL